MEVLTPFYRLIPKLKKAVTRPSHKPSGRIRKTHQSQSWPPDTLSSEASPQHLVSLGAMILWPDHLLLDLGTGSLTHRGPWPSFELRSLPCPVLFGQTLSLLPLRTAFKAPTEAWDKTGVTQAWLT